MYVIFSIFPAQTKAWFTRKNNNFLVPLIAA